MADVVVCCDGTWNTPDDLDGGLPAPTNVFRIYNALAKNGVDGAPIKRYYHPGVGTEGGKLRRVWDGAVGRGLSENVKSAYRWLASAYDPNDRIWLFGFSRGAYTARSVGGMIGRCGLLDLRAFDDDAAWAAVGAAFADYRAKRDDVVASEARPVHGAALGAPVKGIQSIHFIGVWDTVGALGVPDDLAILARFDDPTRYAFHDTEPSKSVAHARHAVALDERRKSFMPTLWDDLHPEQDLKQVWFPGVHSDVGGGYGRCGLSDGALRWMMDEARDAPTKKTGLAFRSDEVLGAFIRPDPCDVLHDSATGVFEKLRTQPRPIPNFDVSDKEDRAAGIHKSARCRVREAPLTQPSYWPTRVLAEGQSTTPPIDVYARDPWNATHLYLEEGVTYRFEATGRWLDKRIPCGPEGTKDHKFHPSELVHVAFSAWGKLEGLYHRFVRRQDADLPGTKREEGMEWFVLVGMIASGAWFHVSDGSPATRPLTKEERRKVVQNQSFRIGSGTTFTPLSSGYLYCFANDVWGMYGNNRGSVKLTVSRA